MTAIAERLGVSAKTVRNLVSNILTKLQVADRAAAIAKAGGLNDRASNTIRIKRRGADGKDIEIRANYRRIVSGKEPDAVLKPDDVLIVKESFF